LTGQRGIDEGGSKIREFLGASRRKDLQGSVDVIDWVRLGEGSSTDVSTGSEVSMQRGGGGRVRKMPGLSGRGGFRG